MRKPVCMGLIALLFMSISTQVWATTDLSTLGTPTVTISPTSGPPGTEITITISNLPDISKESYPYPDLYIFLPFSKPFGVTVPSHCEGVDCFPVYTHGDAVNHNLADRTITFSLFSSYNPKPVYLNGFENSVCDVILNGKTVQRYSALCNAKDQPTGTYDIKLAWALQTNLEEAYVVKYVQFTVTSGTPPPSQPTINPADLIIKQYQNGTISESQFESKLKALGWNDEQIRQAKAVIGRLPHQGVVAPPPQNVTNTVQNITTPPQAITTPATTITTTNTTTITTINTPKNGCLIATAAFGSELAPQVQFLREIRDHSILTTTTGASFITAFNTVYYSFSPTVADAERENPLLRDSIRTALYPLLGILQLSQISELGKSDLTVIGSGFVVASLIGATYAWPTGLALKGVRNGIRPNLKIAIGAVVIATVSVLGALAFSNQIALMFSTSILVLSLIAVSAVFTAWSIVKLSQKIRNTYKIIE